MGHARGEVFAARALGHGGDMQTKTTMIEAGSANGSTRAGRPRGRVSKRLVAVLAVGLGVAAGACGSDDDSGLTALSGGGAAGAGGGPSGASGATAGAGGVCVPGSTQACLGKGACSGAQQCVESGSGWGECECAGPGGQAGVGGAGGAGGDVAGPGGGGQSAGAAGDAGGSQSGGASTGGAGGAQAGSGGTAVGSSGAAGGGGAAGASPAGGAAGASAGECAVPSDVINCAPRCGPTAGALCPPNHPNDFAANGDFLVEAPATYLVEAVPSPKGKLCSKPANARALRVTEKSAFRVTVNAPWVLTHVPSANCKAGPQCVVTSTQNSFPVLFLPEGVDPSTAPLAVLRFETKQPCQ